jgi:acyl carrier protein
VPYTPNGKLDKEALFALDEAQRTRLTPTVALDEMEQKVWQTWTRILGDKQILPNPAVNFFELGGNSLHLTKMVAELNQEFGLDVSISEFLKNLTLAQQATWLSELTEGKDIEELEW